MIIPSLPVCVVITPALGDHASTEAAATRVKSFLLPHLPPCEQQRIAQDPQRDPSTQYISVLPDHEAVAGGLIVVGGVTLEGNLSTIDGRLLATSIALAFKAAAPPPEVGDVSEEHVVLQAATPMDAARALLGTQGSAAGAMLDLEVRFQGREPHNVTAPRSMTGLQLKSLVIAALGLDGGFQNYYMTLDGAPFGSRTPISSHPSILPQAAGSSGTIPVLELELTGDRPKAVGHT